MCIKREGMDDKANWVEYKLTGDLGRGYMCVFALLLCSQYFVNFQLFQLLKLKPNDMTAWHMSILGDEVPIRPGEYPSALPGSGSVRARLHGEVSGETGRMMT